MPQKQEYFAVAFLIALLFTQVNVKARFLLKKAVVTVDSNYLLSVQLQLLLFYMDLLLYQFVCSTKKIKLYICN